MSPEPTLRLPGTRCYDNCESLRLHCGMVLIAVLFMYLVFGHVNAIRPFMSYKAAVIPFEESHTARDSRWTLTENY